MIYLCLMLAMVLCSYYFALAQRMLDVPYMWIERNLVLIFMSNLVVSFCLYEFTLETFKDPELLFTFIALFTLIPAVLFTFFYKALKPVAENVYAFKR